MRPKVETTAQAIAPDGEQTTRGPCTIADAARKQMAVHRLLQKQVEAGKMAWNYMSYLWLGHRGLRPAPGGGSAGGMRAVGEAASEVRRVIELSIHSLMAVESSLLWGRA